MSLFQLLTLVTLSVAFLSAAADCRLAKTEDVTLDGLVAAFQSFTSAACTVTGMLDVSLTEFGSCICVDVTFDLDECSLCVKEKDEKSDVVAGSTEAADEFRNFCDTFGVSTVASDEDEMSTSVVTSTASAPLASVTQAVSASTSSSSGLSNRPADCPAGYWLEGPQVCLPHTDSTMATVTVTASAAHSLAAAATSVPSTAGVPNSTAAALAEEKEEAADADSGAFASEVKSVVVLLTLVGAASLGL
ncbi:hypothetical protein JCM11641_006498 [Rhodosporidiobolus odoratus]